VKQFWNERYQQSEYVYGENPNGFFREKLLKLLPGSILLPGEGEGRNAVWAARQGWKVATIDYSEAARSKALALAERHGGVAIDYHLDDIDSFPYPKDHFDAAALIFIHHSPEMRLITHRKIMDALKPGGYIIVEAFTPEQLNYNSGGPKNPEMLYTAEILCSDFASLNILFVDVAIHTLDEGKHHSGPASTVRLFAQKPSD